MHSLARMFSAGAALFAACIIVSTAADIKAPPPPRSLEMIESDIAILADDEGPKEKSARALVAALEKGTGMDEKQKASAHARLLALAEQARVGLAQQRALTMDAINSPSKNGSNGGKTKTATAEQANRLAKINELEQRLAALRVRIDALDPSKKSRR